MLQKVFGEGEVTITLPHGLHENFRNLMNTIAFLWISEMRIDLAGETKREKKSARAQTHYNSVS